MRPRTRNQLPLRVISNMKQIALLREFPTRRSIEFPRAWRLHPTACIVNMFGEAPSEALSLPCNPQYD